MGQQYNMSQYRKHREAGAKARNNGQQFESLIERACLRYMALKIAYIEKTPEPMKPLSKANQYGQFAACYVKHAQPDYKGTLKGGRAVVFEAKHTDGQRIEQNRVTPEQAAALNRHESMGALCFVLVSFSFENFYAVPWKVWRDMAGQFGKVSANEKDLLPYLAPGIMTFLDKPLGWMIQEETGKTPLQHIQQGMKQPPMAADEHKELKKVLQDELGGEITKILV
jgi:recombination protein U